MQHAQSYPELSIQDAFARHGFRQGYPLWNPDPTLLSQDRQDSGIEIGDIGIVDEDGRFHPVLNIYHSSSPDTEPDVYECETFDPGHVFSSPRTSWSKEDRHAMFGRVITQYTSSLTKNGSHIIVPQGAKSFKLATKDKSALERLAADSGRCITWFDRASEHLGFTPKSLHLITGLCQTRSWSLVSFDKDDDGAVKVCCELVEDDGKLQMGDAGSHWAPLGRFDCKIGPPTERQGNCNQTIFIQSLIIMHTTTVAHNAIGLQEEAEAVQSLCAEGTVAGSKGTVTAANWWTH